MSITDAYLGNPNLKKVNTPVEFTKEQVIESVSYTHLRAHET